MEDDNSLEVALESEHPVEFSEDRAKDDFLKNVVDSGGVKLKAKEAEGLLKASEAMAREALKNANSQFMGMALAWGIEKLANEDTPEEVKKEIALKLYGKLPAPDGLQEEAINIPPIQLLMPRPADK